MERVPKFDVLTKKQGEGIYLKADAYVLETNVHFPTDMSLLWDAGRKCLDMVEDAIKEGLLDWNGWRKLKYLRRELKTLTRVSAKASGGAGKNKDNLVRHYVEWSRKLSEKIDASLLALYERVERTKNCWACIYRR